MIGARLWIIVFILLAPALFASGLRDIEFGDSLGDLGRSLDEALQNDDAVFFAVFVLIYMILFLLFKRLIAHVPVFGDSKQGRTVAGSLSLLVVIGLFWKGKAVMDTAAEIVGGLGSVLLILAGIILFWGVGRKIGATWGGIISGILLIGLGYYIDSPWVLPIGILFLIIGIIKGAMQIGVSSGNPYTHPDASPGRRRHWIKDTMGALGGLGRVVKDSLAGSQTVQNESKDLYSRNKKKEAIEADLARLNQLSTQAQQDIMRMVRERADPHIVQDRIRRLAQQYEQEVHDTELLEKEDSYEQRTSRHAAEHESDLRKEARHEMERLERDHVKSQDEWELERTEKEDQKRMRELFQELETISHEVTDEKRAVKKTKRELRRKLKTLHALGELLDSGHSDKLEKLLRKLETSQGDQVKNIQTDTQMIENALRDIYNTAAAASKLEEQAQKDLQAEEEEVRRAR
ncbi:MAG: hypothetical protein ACQESG_01800 [Nanobdellota archaeon]